MCQTYHLKKIVFFLTLKKIENKRKGTFSIQNYAKMIPYDTLFDLKKKDFSPKRCLFLQKGVLFYFEKIYKKITQRDPLEGQFWKYV